MESSSWCIVCIALAIALAVFACAICLLARSLDDLIKQLDQVNKGERQSIEVYSRNRRVVAAAQLINSGYERFQEKLDAKDDDLNKLNEELAFFSHDIRTPTAVIQGYMELLEIDEDEDNRRGYRNRIREKLASMRAMIDELCDYSIIAANNETSSCKGVAVYELLCSVLADHYEAFSARGWEPRIAFDDEGYCVMCPEGDLRRVFSNLVGNILKYSAAEPHIVLHDNVLRISNEVTDPDGIDTTRMFDRFWRGDSARSGNGNGLGLAVARALCERMGVGIEAFLHGGVLNVELTFPKEERVTDLVGRQV